MLARYAYAEGGFDYHRLARPEVRSRLACMNRSPFFICGFAVVLFCWVAESSAQAASSSAVQGGVVLSALAQPLYPPLARQAHISGDVDLTLGIRRDGSIESVVAVNGQAMLKPAALDSVQRSKFDCRACKDEVNSYSLTYRFLLTPTDPKKYCADLAAGTPPSHSSAELDPSQHVVAVVAEQIWTCDEGDQLRRVRSLKCLYLWKCGLR